MTEFNESKAHSKSNMIDEERSDFATLTYDDINIIDCFNQARSNKAGAVSSFLGTTRDNFEGKEVTHLEYEAYYEMALDSILEICKQARDKWDLIRIVIQHKLGSCPISNISVAIYISSEHRTDSLEAVNFAINELKKTVPIWKKECYSNGNNTWKANQNEPIVAYESTL